MSGDMVAWLREQVQGRLETARAACHDSDGHWFRQLRPLYLNEPPVPSGALYEGDMPDTDEDGDWLWYPEIVVYAEGRPSDAQFDHIAANDPQQVIADCEAELAILDEAVDVAERYGEESVSGRIALHFVDLLSTAYRHKPGYQEARRL